MFAQTGVTVIPAVPFTDPGSAPLDSLAYAPPPGLFDEMVAGPGGTVRPAWQRLAVSLGGMSREDMVARWDRGQRLIRDNGITYNVYDDPEGLARPWQLDPVPLVIAGQEWQGIETALVQRATLLNLILQDLYGPRRLLREGLLPPALVFGNPFWLPVVQDASIVGPWLHFHAADLARSPDGQWWVVADRTEAPSGAGYALENRSIVTRVLPEAYRAAQVRRMAPWFLKVRESLAVRAPLNRDTPRIVLMTPGPFNETWFEHAFLSRQLGLSLVEGEDLTVRDGRVLLKTTEGLKPVDVILRRTDSAFCDPLELRHDSTLGVPGLVEAVHRGTVTVANALGSGLIEAPALLAFLPALCRALLGVDLKMPSVATWWCGQPRELAYVLDNLPRLALRSAFFPAMPPLAGATLSHAEREDLIARVKAAPEQWVAQEAVALSTAPSWTEAATLEPRPVVLRVHACALGLDSYSLLPGGLTRTGPAPYGLSVSMQQGGGSKDTWVLPDPTALPDLPPTPSGSSAVSSVRLQRGVTDLPSRMADHLFWLGRYIERSEDLTRLLRATAARVPEGSGSGSGLETALGIFQRLGHLPLDGATPATATSPDEDLTALLTINLSPKATLGLSSCVRAVQRVAQVARDRLSLDTWRAIDALPTRLRELGTPSHLNADDAARGLDRLVSTLLALAGHAQESMTRGLGWRFLDMGRRLERAFHMLDLLDAVTWTPPAERSAALDLALDVADGVMTYRARYASLPQLAPVLDLMVCDETNPRSFAFQVARLMEHVNALAPDPLHQVFTEEQRMVIALQATVRTLNPDHITPPEATNGVSLATLTRTLRDDLRLLSDLLTRQYFFHAAETSLRRTTLPLEEENR